MIKIIKKNLKNVIIITTAVFLVCALTIIVLAKFREEEKKKEIAFNYVFAKNDIDEGRYEEAIEELEKILDYKDSKQLLIRAKYEYAIKLYDNKEFENSKLIFQQLGDYDKSLEYLNKIPEDLKIYEILKGYIGTWCTSEFFRVCHIIDGSLVVPQYTLSSEGEYSNLAELKCTIDGESLNCPSMNSYNPNPTILYLKEDGVYWYRKQIEPYLYYDIEKTKPIIETNEIMTRISTGINLPKPVTQAKRPYIGMTKSEAKNSTWGEPKKINKTTTKYGTQEQWVYEGYKYLYFNESGTLTSIQE